MLIFYFRYAKYKQIGNPYNITSVMLLCFLLITSLREAKPLGYSYNSEKRKTTAIILVIIIMLLLATVVGLTFALFTSGEDGGKIGEPSIPYKAT